MVKAYLPKQRRFECVLDEDEEGKDKAATAGKRPRRAGRSRKKKKAEETEAGGAACGKSSWCGPARPAGSCARDDQAAGVRGLWAGALLRGKGCQKAAWRGHKSFCKFARKETCRRPRSRSGVQSGWNEQHSQLPKAERPRRRKASAE